MRAIIFLGLLVAIIPAHASDFVASGDGFQLRLQERPVGKIQHEWHGRLRDAKRYEDQAAFLISHGHRWHEQIRDSQQKIVWYLGKIEPDANIKGEPSQAEIDRLLRYEVPFDYAQEALNRYAKPFNWTYRQELVLVFKDGRRLAAELIIASEGVVLNLNPYKPRSTVYIYPLEHPLRFTDFMRIIPSRDHFACSVWCGFPRRPRIDGKPWRWDPKDVAAIELSAIEEGNGHEKAELGDGVSSRVDLGALSTD
ncbi:MAG: hypothetical protein KAY24_12225 [Candidatus Eisenbacteria sp.]|nr:hypothetical protein [Candidatus Eisenbacteria bacterium]